MAVRELESRARRDHRRQRRHLRGPPRRLPVPRAVAQPRPLVPVRAAQGRAGARSTSRRRGPSEKMVPDDRGRVRPQAADDGRPPRHRRRRPDVGPARLRAAVRLRDRLPPAAPLREPAPARCRLRSPTSLLLRQRAGSTGSRSPSSSACSRSPRPSGRRGARPGRARIARYYVLVTASIALGFWDRWRNGPPAAWEKSEGTR